MTGYDPLVAATRAVAEELLRQYEREYQADHLDWTAFQDDARTLVRLALPQIADAVREVAARGVEGSQHPSAVGLGAGLMSAALLMERWANPVVTT